jgi:hypothetical protein
LLAEVSTLIDTNNKIQEILHSLTNYAYFIAHATKVGEVRERNNRFYILNS